MSICLPEEYKIVQGCAPYTTNGGKTGDYVSLKNVHRAWVIFELRMAAAFDQNCGIMRATAVAPTGATAMTETAKIWLNDNTDSTDTLVAQTDAASITATSDTNNKMVVIQIDPEKLTKTFDCIAGICDDSSEATNFVSMTYVLEYRYGQATPPTAITD